MNTGAPHHRYVEGIAGREPIQGVDECLGGPHLGNAEGEDLVGDRIQVRECNVDGVEPPDCSVSMSYLLVDFYVGDQPFPVSGQLCQQRKNAVLVGKSNNSSEGGSHDNHI